MTNEERQGLVEGHLGIVRPIVAKAMRRYAVPEELREELVAAGNLGLVKAGVGYDPDKGGFGSYAFTRVKGEVLDALGRDARVHLNEELARDLFDLPSTAANPEEHVANKEAVTMLLAKLPDRERHIVEMHYLRDVPQTELAQEQGVSKSYLHRLQSSAIEKFSQRLDAEDKRALER